MHALFLAFSAFFAWVRGGLKTFFATTPGAVKGLINADEFHKLVVLVTGNTTLVLAITSTLTFALSFFVDHVALLIPNPFLAGLVVAFLSVVLGGMRLKNQGHLSQMLAEGSIVPSGGALTPPPASLSANDLAPPPSTFGPSPTSPPTGPRTPEAILTTAGLKVSDLTRS